MFFALSICVSLFLGFLASHWGTWRWQVRLPRVVALVWQSVHFEGVVLATLCLLASISFWVRRPGQALVSQNDGVLSWDSLQLCLRQKREFPLRVPVEPLLSWRWLHVGEPLPSRAWHGLLRAWSRLETLVIPRGRSWSSENVELPDSDQESVETHMFIILFLFKVLTFCVA